LIVPCGWSVKEIYSILIYSQKDPTDPEALCDLGYMNETGYGTEKNSKEAVKYYVMSAKIGYARGQCNLAYMHEYGEGCEKDFKIAEMYYTLSANQGLARGQCNLGYMYNNGTGVPKDQKKAEEYYKMAAKQGYNKAQYNLALLYHYSVSQRKLAVKYFYLAAEQGHLSAHRHLNKIFDGTHGEQYLTLAVEFLADEWPNTHQLINQKCRLAIMELFYILKNHCSVSLPQELILLATKHLICSWNGKHYCKPQTS